MIHLESVSKRYGARTIVQDITFSVAKGEIVGFLGPNGAGKTTTMRLVAGYTTATSGRVEVAGFDMATDRESAAQRIGYLPEQPPLYDTLNVTQYLRFVARAKGLGAGAIRHEIPRVASACRLESVLDREIYKLSKGFRQRVGLAQALLGEPDVLLLDEPTAGLDPGQIQETREVIRAVGQNHAVLISTHILPEVTMICNRVVIISNGRLLAVDSPANLQRASEQANRVVIHARAPETEVRSVLMTVDGVRQAQVSPMAGLDGMLKIECEIDDRAGVEADLARALASRWELYRLERQQPSLENVFLQYVGSQRGESGATQ